MLKATNIIRLSRSCRLQFQRLLSESALPNKEAKPEFVNNVFKNVAPKYDLMNDLMSLYIHRLWKDYFISKLKPLPATKLLDVAGGTGDIAMRFLKVADKDSHVTICDINEHMMNEGRKKYPNEPRLEWVVGDAQELPFEDNSFDAYTIAYGIRNVADIEQALSEAHRVLKTGGIFMCLEFSDFKNPILKKIYERYLLEVLPVMGEVVVGDYMSYRYLAESILDFPEQEDFKRMITEAGFKYASYENLMQGISSIHYGFKRE
jgi:ubiquinone/menaquinone biosynthesis methyltransferase